MQYYIIKYIKNTILKRYSTFRWTCRTYRLKKGFTTDFFTSLSNFCSLDLCRTYVGLVRTYKKKSVNCLKVNGF